MMDKYNQKLLKVKEQQKKYQGIMLLFHSQLNKLELTNLTLDLVDKTGERKFCCTSSKAESIANTFLTDKGIYYLAKIISTPQPNSSILIRCLNLL
jgi:hypothetical protein